MDPLKTILALFLILSGSFESAAAGLACYTCSDGCDHPREPGMGVMTEHCDLEKDQAPICASFFDPENRHYNYGRGCVRMSDRPQEFQESECVIMDVADFWNPNGPKRKTCVCFCSFSECNYEELCYNPAEINTPGFIAGSGAHSHVPSYVLTSFIVAILSIVSFVLNL